MTVPSNPNDAAPRRLLQPAGAPELPPSFRPLGGAEPAALREMIAALIRTTLDRELAAVLGAAAYERRAERRGVRNGSRPRTLLTRVGRLTRCGSRGIAARCFSPRSSRATSATNKP